MYDPQIQVNSANPQTLSLTITENTPGATINYTTNGTTPTASSPSITSGSTLVIPRNVTLNVQAFVGTSSSSLITQTYTSQGGISAGQYHTLLLKNDGTVWASGDDTYGEIGIGTTSTTPQTTPAEVMVNSSTPLANIVAVAAGTYESFAVDSSGNVWFWGYNVHGESGLGTTGPITRPTQITALTNIVGIASNQYHTLAIRNDGAAFGWGANAYAQAGTGTASSYVTTPTRVVAPSGQSGYLTGIVAVATGANHSLALDSQGNVWSWGSNSNFQLGTSASGDTAYPTQVLTGAISISAGTSNSFALLGGGTVQSWGAGTRGQLGDGLSTNLQDTATPQTVSGLSGIAALDNQCAVDSNGNTYTWGDNSAGQIGVGVTGNFATVPITVNLYSGAAPTLAINSGNNQQLKDGVLSAPLSITATSSGSAVTNTPIYFVVPSGYGLLTTATGTTPISGIVQTTTNASGLATAYFAAEPGYFNSSAVSAASQIVASIEGGQTTFNATAIADPLLNLAAGNYAAAQTITINDTTSGATIYYTLDGSNPASSSTRQAISPGGTISITQNATLQIEAFYNSGASNLISAIYTIGTQVATDTPTMPQWALIILAVMLIAAARSRLTKSPKDNYVASQE